MKAITALTAPPSLARSTPSDRPALRIGLVQHHWRDDADELNRVLHEAIGTDGRGPNTAILVSPAGELVARTRKLHIPVSAGYYEDTYFRPGPADDAYPATEVPALGVELVVWLPRGLARDSERFGTRGHVDIVATIPSPGTLLLHAQPDAAHPDHEVMLAVRATLEASTDAGGTSWHIIDLPGPEGLRDTEGWVDHSYVNHLVVNGGVIAQHQPSPVPR